PASSDDWPCFFVAGSIWVRDPHTSAGRPPSALFGGPPCGRTARIFLVQAGGGRTRRCAAQTPPPTSPAFPSEASGTSRACRGTCQPPRATACKMPGEHEDTRRLSYRVDKGSKNDCAHVRPVH